MTIRRRLLDLTVLTSLGVGLLAGVQYYAPVPPPASALAGQPSSNPSLFGQLPGSTSESESFGSPIRR